MGAESILITKELHRALRPSGFVRRYCSPFEATTHKDGIMLTFPTYDLASALRLVGYHMAQAGQRRLL